MKSRRLDGLSQLSLFAFVQHNRMPPLISIWWGTQCQTLVTLGKVSQFWVRTCVTLVTDPSFKRFPSLHSQCLNAIWMSNRLTLDYRSWNPKSNSKVIFQITLTTWRPCRHLFIEQASVQTRSHLTSNEHDLSCRLPLHDTTLFQCLHNGTLLLLFWSKCCGYTFSGGRERAVAVIAVRYASKLCQEWSKCKVPLTVSCH